MSFLFFQDKIKTFECFSLIMLMPHLRLRRLATFPSIFSDQYKDDEKMMKILCENSFPETLNLSLDMTDLEFLRLRLKSSFLNVKLFSQNFSTFLYD